ALLPLPVRPMIALDQSPAAAQIVHPIDRQCSKSAFHIAFATSPAAPVVDLPLPPFDVPSPAATILPHCSYPAESALRAPSSPAVNSNGFVRMPPSRAKNRAAYTAILHDPIASSSRCNPGTPRNFPQSLQSPAINVFSLPPATAPDPTLAPTII